MTTKITLVELAEEHLKRMASVPWDAYAASIHRGKAGETFGCEVDDVYFDVGDQARWNGEADGDVLLVTHASTSPADGSVLRVERELIIPRP